MNEKQKSAYNIGSDQNIGMNTLQLVSVEIAKIDCFNCRNRFVEPCKHFTIYITLKSKISLSSTFLKMYSVTSLQ